MERDYLQFDLQKPPLPFVGNKLRWWHELRPMIEALPRGARVFDAFTGCFAVSKLLQRWGRELRIVANDCGRYYRRRLADVADTNRVITGGRRHLLKESLRTIQPRNRAKTYTNLRDGARSNIVQNKSVLWKRINRPRAVPAHSIRRGRVRALDGRPHVRRRPPGRAFGPGLCRF